MYQLKQIKKKIITKEFPLKATYQGFTGDVSRIEILNKRFLKQFIQFKLHFS